MAEDKETKATTTRRTARTRSTSSRRPRTTTPKPPNSVRPGWVHEALAKVTLALIEKRAPMPVDVGTVEQAIPDAISTEENGTEPVDLLARVYAHAAHRVPGVKRVEKKLEGKDFTSGFLSDLSALLVQLYRRNQPAIDGLMTEAANSALSKREASKASTAAPTASSNGGATPGPGFAPPPVASPVPPVSPPPSFTPSAVPNE